MFGVGALQVTFGNERSSLSALLSWIVCRSYTRTYSFAERDLSRVPLVACSSCGAAVVCMLLPQVLVILCACRRARRRQNSVGFASWNLETLRDASQVETSWQRTCIHGCTSARLTCIYACCCRTGGGARQARRRTKIPERIKPSRRFGI